MKSFDSRVYSINDFVEWDKHKQLILNPTFQRRAVWSDKAKSFLMDTIVRGKPIPKVFIRQKINVTTKVSAREVVDGQQRLRSILSYIKDGFAIPKRMHPEYGGLLFSQLPEDVQSQILSYEIAVDLLINLPDAEILDIFGRLNSYAVILNEQEKLNANHFGAFKVLADQVGRKYYEYWIKQKILTAKEILRMAEVALVADLLIALLEGIKNRKQVARYYDRFEDSFDHDPVQVEANFDAVIVTITKLFPEGLGETEFSRPFLFYTLFTAVAHCIHGLPNLDRPRLALTTDAMIAKARNGLDRVEELFAIKDAGQLTEQEQQFLQDSRRATTDPKVRERRTEYLLSLMG
ncbi:DUF262 domain-containing protein [Bradyrhizobium sp. RP6]|uniref:DUF262 domain-containing protein n=1 Tax=Bradyrhizobium sp. RP6 TaxID=2489596 RepID=UPI000F524FFA|nr:DUF262 domain-containing protein [Bradyrhizobium sp. RP6]RQH08698.1 DUF262 domain-containing protein [Bradyrhizobium sp. RP6]